MHIPNFYTHWRNDKHHVWCGWNADNKRWEVRTPKKTVASYLCEWTARDKFNRYVNYLEKRRGK